MAEVIDEPNIVEAPSMLRSFKLVTVIAVAFFFTLLVVGTVLVINKVRAKHEIQAARIVSDKAIAALDTRDGAAAYKLGTATFKKTYTAQELTKQFKSVEVATLGTPSFKKQTVIREKSGITVFFVYTYTKLKVPYYIRTAIVQKSGHWQLTNFSGNADESDL